jgi:hypothetical protein
MYSWWVELTEVYNDAVLFLGKWYDVPFLPVIGLVVECRNSWKDADINNATITNWYYVLDDGGTIVVELSITDLRCGKCIVGTPCLDEDCVSLLGNDNDKQDYPKVDDVLGNDWNVTRIDINPVPGTTQDEIWKTRR